MAGAGSIFRRPWAWVAAGVVVVVAAAVGLALFQPWKLVVDDTVDEEAPAVVVASRSGPASAGPTPSAAGRPTATVVATGEFISHEHATTGRLQVIALADSRRILRLENVDTSNGPDLRVWITDAPVKQGSAGWRVFDDGRYVDLGRLKGNLGSQNYELPASVDLAQLDSVSIWCARFKVSFGAATLRPV